MMVVLLASKSRILFFHILISFSRSTYPPQKRGIIKDKNEIRICGLWIAYDANQKKNTIIFGYYGGKNYSEYVICSQEAVESWSYGTSEIQIEMMNEYEWVEKNKTRSDMYDRFYKTKSNRNFTDKDYSPSNYFNFAIDEKDWTKRALNEKFSNIETLVNGDHPGQVFYQQGMNKSRINHYKVKYPDYFNL